MSETRSSDADALSTRILDLVSELPEIYQPIYGQPQVLGSRTADSDRIDLVARTVAEVATTMGRPLRILDLGTAQGYLAFRLAEAGHRVVGIEGLAQNVAVARAVAEQHPHLDVAFVEGDVLDSPTLVDLGSFDLVLGLSVLHHVIDRDGQERAGELVTALARSVPHGVYEMALAAEPVFWAPSLPADPRVTLAPYPFVRTIGRSGTHLSDVQRPILFASCTHVLTADGLRAIDSWGEQSHRDAPDRGLRRHFMVGGDVVKIAARFVESGEDEALDVYRRELRNEAHVLEVLRAADVEAPRLLEFVDGADESLLVRTSYPGVLLSEVAPSLNDEQRALVTGQVLESLAALEALGLHHTDLRLWNVIWDPVGSRAHLIDHGAVAARAGDVMWPDDGYFSLLVWLVSLWGPFHDQTGVRVPRSSRIDESDGPAEVNALIGQLMAHPRDAHVYRDLLASWTDARTGADPSWPVAPVAWRWLAELERQRDGALEMQRSYSRDVEVERHNWTTERTGLIAEHHAWLDQRKALSEERDGLAAERDRLTGERDRLTGDLAASRADAAGAHAAVRELYATWSWRITRPIRALRSRGS